MPLLITSPLCPRVRRTAQPTFRLPFHSSSKRSRNAPRLPHTCAQIHSPEPRISCGSAAHKWMRKRCAAH